MKNAIFTFFILVAVCILPNISFGQSPQKIFNDALILEEAEGELEKAILAYRSITENEKMPRIWQARAMLHIGHCYEKLGNNRARATYRNILSSYGDQLEVVTLAKEKLKSLESLHNLDKPESVVATQLNSLDEDIYGISHDGKYINIIDWYQIRIVVKELASQEVVWTSPKGTWKEPSKFPDRSILSPDGKSISYFWFTGDHTELHIARLDGTSDELIVRGHHVAWPVLWTSDSKYLVCLSSMDHTEVVHEDHEIVVYDIENRNFRTVMQFKNSNFHYKFDLCPNDEFLIYARKKRGVEQKFNVYKLNLNNGEEHCLIDSEFNDFSPFFSNDGNRVYFLSDRYGTTDLWKLNLKEPDQLEIAEMVKANFGNEVRIFHLDKQNNLFYSANESRMDIHYIDLNNGNTQNIQNRKISNLDPFFNINPAISFDGRQIAYYEWNLERDDVLGSPYNITLVNTETFEKRKLPLFLYGNPMKYWKQMVWTPDHKSLLMYGLKKDGLRGGIYIYDTVNKKLKTIRSEANITRHNENGRFGYLYHFGGDKNAFYYLSTDRKSIIKLNLLTDQETVIYKDSLEMRSFRVSNDEQQIAFGYFFNNRNELYCYSIPDNTRKKLVTTNESYLPQPLNWDKNSAVLYYADGKFRDIQALMRVSPGNNKPEVVKDLKKVFPGEVVARMSLDASCSKMAVELMVGKGHELWKLSGLIN